MEHPIAISNFFIEKSFATGEELTPMKLVKLVYISHGWHLAIENEPLINEAVCAWKYGPVIKSVYHRFKEYGSGQITEMEFIWEGPNLFTPLPSENKRAFLEKIWDVYGKKTGVQLSTLTHQLQTPWDIVWKEKGGNQQEDAIIPNDLIQTYYKQKIVSHGNPRSA